MSEMTVEDAEQEARDAEALALQLEERIRSGDETVTPDDLAEAERLSKFARLRIDAAKRKAAERRKTAALEEAEAFKARLLEQAAAKDSSVVDAWSALVAALRRVAAVAEERWAIVDAHVRERSKVGLRVREDAGVELAELGVLPGRYGEHGYQIPEAGVDVRQVSTAQLVVEAMAVALGPDGLSRVESTSTQSRRLDELPKMPKITAVVGWPEAVTQAVAKRGADR